MAISKQNIGLKPNSITLLKPKSDISNGLFYFLISFSIISWVVSLLMFILSILGIFSLILEYKSDSIDKKDIISFILGIINIILFIVGNVIIYIFKKYLKKRSITLRVFLNSSKKNSIFYFLFFIMINIGNIAFLIAIILLNYT